VETFQLAGAGPLAYEEHLVSRIFDPLAARLVTLVAPAPGDRVLDVACGTGAVARRASASDATVVGVDLNDGMLALARQLAPSARFVPGDAAALPFPAHSFDLVYCQQGLQFMADPAAALRSMFQVLRPGGRIAVALWRDLALSPGFAALVDALDRHVGPDAGNVLRGPFAMGEHTAVAGLAAAAGFDAVRVSNVCLAVPFPSVPELVSLEIASTPLADAAGSWPAGALAAITADVAAALHGFTADDGLLFPMGGYVVTGRSPDV
jgi:SAM-dependent methyltransferase